MDRLTMPELTWKFPHCLKLGLKEIHKNFQASQATRVKWKAICKLCPLKDIMSVSIHLQIHDNLYVLYK